MNVNIWWICLSLGVSLTIGCAGGQAQHDHDETTAESESKLNRGVCSNRWVPPQAYSEARTVTHVGSGPRCSGRAQSGAISLGNFVREKFAANLDLAVAGRGVQIYNCRTVRGGSNRSVHGEGRAIDLFIPTRSGSRANSALGDELANWLAANAHVIGIQYIIWNRTSWKGSRNPQHQCYTGSHPHNDHVHVELSWAGAREETPFFRDADLATTPEAPPANTHEDDLSNGNEAASEAPPEPTPAPGNDDDAGPGEEPTPEPESSNGGMWPPSDWGNEPEAAPPPAEPAPQPRVEATQWLGEPCEVDAECVALDGGVQPACFRPMDRPGYSGFCTVSCEGFCPDLTGKPETFCADASTFRAPLSGLCVAKAHPLNASCAAWPDFSAWEAPRFVGASNARARTAVVCLAARPYEYGEEATDPEEAESICGVSGLAVSDHAHVCTGVVENTWRCACSPRFETVVSQVCRSGIWINYDLDPVDCSRCDGNYSSGCEPRSR